MRYCSQAQDCCHGVQANSIFMILQQPMDQAEAQFDSTIDQLEEAQRNVEITSDTLIYWGLNGLSKVNSKIDYAIDCLSDDVKVIRPTKNGSTATALTNGIAGFIRSITFISNPSMIYPYFQTRNQSKVWRCCCVLLGPETKKN